jgi:hypothetical protein
MVASELFNNGQLSRRKLAFLRQCLENPDVDLTVLEREKIYAHPLIRESSKSWRE